MINNNILDLVSARFPALADKSTVEILDFLFDASRAEKRGISIDIVLSTSGKKINGRIYRPIGHKNGISSWTEPYRKPLILNHEPNGDPKGRIQSVRWEAEPKARDFFTTDRDYENFIDVLDTGSAKEIQKTMNRHRLLQDKSWPGVGHLVATLQVKDRETAEKIIDERYLTFSQSSNTDAYVCGECGSDWKKSSRCKHRPGTADKKGDVCVAVCGNLYGSEVSIVNMPGNDLSMTRSISFEDSEGGEEEVITLSDLEQMSHNATFNEDIGEDMPLKDISEEAVSRIVEAVIAKVKTEKEESKPKDPNMQKLDGLYQKRLKKTKDEETLDIFLFKDGEEKLFPVSSLEDLEALSEMLTLIDAEEISSLLSASMESAKLEISKRVSDSKLSEELAETKTALEQIKLDYAKALDQIKELEAKITDKKEEKNEDAAVTGLDVGENSNQNAEDIKHIDNPSESGLPSLSDSKATSQEKTAPLVPEQKHSYYVQKYKKLTDSKGEKAAKEYLAQIKGAAYVPFNFDPKLYI